MQGIDFLILFLQAFFTIPIEIFHHHRLDVADVYRTAVTHSLEYYQIGFRQIIICQAMLSGRNLVF